MELDLRRRLRSRLQRLSQTFTRESAQDAFERECTTDDEGNDASEEGGTPTGDGSTVDLTVFDPNQGPDEGDTGDPFVLHGDVRMCLDLADVLEEAMDAEAALIEEINGAGCAVHGITGDGRLSLRSR